tara:strand:+ start:523 stop:1020 length:498 start_codon:yes stop_codon:yes gene_type:complete
MLMLRLQRVGRKNEPHYKIVVIEKTKGPKSQKYVDIVGSYNPKMGQVTMKEESVKSWLSKGVQPSDTVHNMLIDKGILEGKKINVLPKKSPTKKKNAPDEPEVKEAPAPAEEVAPVEATEEATVTEEVASEPEELVEEPTADELETAAEQSPEVPSEIDDKENQA